MRKNKIMRKIKKIRLDLTMFKSVIHVSSESSISSKLMH